MQTEYDMVNVLLHRIDALETQNELLKLTRSLLHLAWTDSQTMIITLLTIQDLETMRCSLHSGVILETK